MRLEDVITALETKPAKRETAALQTLAAYFQRQPFFAGVDFTTLQQICSITTLQRAPPGEALLQAGELTDRMYLLLSGRCSIARHSKKEGYVAPPPQVLRRGQVLAEAALVLSGRRSDVAVVVEAAPTSRDARSSTVGGAAFAVITRTAWSNMCARAQLQPICGAARTALLSCCARSLAAVEPGRRTMEQADDLGAVLRQLPGMAGTPPPVLRALSEATVLRRLPAGTILYEEHTRAESQFVVLSGAVQVRCRLQKLGQSRAAIRSAIRAVVLRRGQSGTRQRAPPTSEAAAVRAAAVVDGEEAGANNGKSVQEKIEEERREREAALEAVKLTREGLRTPVASAKPQATGEKSKKFMADFITRAKQTIIAHDTTGAPIFSTPAAVAPDALSEGPTTVPPPDSSAEPLAPATPTAGSLAPAASSTASASRAASGWQRVKLKLGISFAEGPAEVAGGPQLSPGEGEGEGGDYDESDPMLLEYQRRKAEDAGLVSDVGKLLGGAGARSAHLRGIATILSRKAHYEHSDEEGDEEDEHKDGGGHVRWADGSAGRAGDIDADANAGVEVDEGDGPSVPCVKLVFIDKKHRVASKSVRFVDAAEKLMRMVRERSEGTAAALADGVDGDADAGEPTILHDSDPDIDVEAAAPLPETVLLRGGKAGARGSGGGADGGGGDEAEDEAEGDEGDKLSEDEVVDEDAAEEEHLEQLYGPVSGRVEPGALAGELPPAALSRAAGVSGATPGGPTPVPVRHRRANTAIAAAAGADVLVIALEALRRGAEAVRSDLIAERLAVLGALEPLRGLSEEHQAAVALGAAVISVESNAVVVQQGQLADALYVVLDGEVRLLDDPDRSVGAALAAGGPGSADAAAGSSGALGRAISLDSAALSKAGVRKGPADAGVAGGGGGGEGWHGATKARRAAAALSLLGPGGSFGESVLGYPADLARQAKEKAAAEANASTEGDGEGADSLRAGDGSGGGLVTGRAASHSSVFASAGSAAAGAAGGASDTSGADTNAPPPSSYLASAVATKPSRLLVLPMQLLWRYGYLRAALPPFAEARREALNARRGQVKGTPANLGFAPAGSMHAPGGAATFPVAAGGGGGGVQALQKSPSLTRLPPPRPVEFFEHINFKTLSYPRTAALITSNAVGGGSGNLSGGSSACPSPDRRGPMATTTGRGYESLSTSGSGAGGGGGGSGGGSGLTFSAPVPPNLVSPSSNATSPSGPLALPSAATAPGGGSGGSTPPGGGTVGSRALGALPSTSSFGSGGGLRSRMISSGGTVPIGSGSSSAGGSFGVLRASNGPQALGLVAEEGAAVEPGSDGGPGRGVLPAAMQQAARYEQMTAGELDMLTIRPGEESWQAMGAAAAGGRAPPKPRIARTSMTGGGSPGPGTNRGFALPTGCANTKRMSVSGLSTYGNSTFGGVPATATNTSGAMPSISANGTPPSGAAVADVPNTRGSGGGGAGGGGAGTTGFLHRLESRGRGGPPVLTLESCGEGSGAASGGSNGGSPRAAGPSFQPFGAAPPSPVPSHLGAAGRQGNSGSLPYINTGAGAAAGGAGGGGTSNPNNGSASALARLALVGAAGGSNGGGGGVGPRGSGSGTSTPTATAAAAGSGTAGLYGYGMGSSPASGGAAAGGMRAVRTSYSGSPITVSASPPHGAVASPALTSATGGGAFAALAAVDCVLPMLGAPVPTGWFTGAGTGGGSGGGAGGAAAPPVGVLPQQIRGTRRKTLGSVGGTAGATAAAGAAAAAAAASAAATLAAGGPGTIAGWQQPSPVASSGLPRSSTVTSQPPASSSPPGASRHSGAAAVRVSWDGSTLRGAAAAAAAQRQQQGLPQHSRAAVVAEVAATAALLTAPPQQHVAMMGCIGGGGVGGGTAGMSNGSIWL
ncbi:hypothetical protein HYH02_009664 [Chlamydomonas schloesseri]|uniref:Cyclic nucleotide-binding domain-containing protein n=1 Tax=Chlamydomonas schloesseri TaxID=2026947 RepID=A0A835TNH3_9CHLO|nr:hypothetical protein HYH02_009664 [Chlamydomonas schloesseri]|eukprot:KAG2442176.1 hypothetical protein HYH02_009664 [Chlamydomonas schloesseri]